MTEYVYRVVNAETGEPDKKGYLQKTQHCYLNKGTAKGVATGKNKEEEYLFTNEYRTPPQRPRRHYRVQRSPVVWEDCE